MPDRDSLKEIIRTPIRGISYSSHPTDDTLRDYLAGRLESRAAFDIPELQTASLPKWHRAEVTAHLLTCRRCAQRMAHWRTAPAPNRLKAIWERWTPVPAFARFAMVAQFVIIVGLASVIYFKPAPFFSSSPVASLIPPQAPQTPQPQGMTIPPSESLSDPISQLVQSYPLTIHVTFREDASAREIESLVQSINGMLIFARPSGFMLRLPSGEELDRIVQKLSQSPYIIEARKD